MFSGGFVGVDVFFVISGYLITSILIKELEQGQFSIVRFYERRARRILPALFFVMACCIPFAWMWMLPSQFNDFSQSIVAVNLFASNILFWLKSGYFDAASEENPLLHTWSLAVEEQFYILFPMLLYLLWRFGRRPAFYVIFGLSLVSLLLAQYGFRKYPVANFYLLPTRAWELGSGSLCAFQMVRGCRKESEFLSIMGLSLIAFSILYYDESVPFPSFFSIVPVAGTALLILFNGPTTVVGKILGMPVFVGVGLLSYSAYLWHQPLFAFARLRIYQPSDTLMLVLAGSSLCLAYFSWRFIEQPFRRSQRELLSRRGQIFSTVSIVGCMFMAFGFWGISEDGAPSRFPDLAEVDRRLVVNRGLHVDCEGIFTMSPNCRTDMAPEFLLWGDSFAMHLALGLMSSEENLRLQQHTKSGCPPILGISPGHNGVNWAQNCIAFNDDVFEWLNSSGTVKYVILSTYAGNSWGKIILQDGSAMNQDNNLHVVSEGLLETIQRIRNIGRKAIVFSSTPGNGQDIGRCLSRAALFDWPENRCDFLKDAYSPAVLGALKLMDEIERDSVVVRLDQLICPADFCDTIQDGFLIFRDGVHLSKEGSSYLGKKHSFADTIRARADE